MATLLFWQKYGCTIDGDQEREILAHWVQVKSTIRMSSNILALSALLGVAGCRLPVAGNLPPVPSNPILPYTALIAPQTALFAAYPGVASGNAESFWASTLNLSQRVEFAGASRAVIAAETAHGWQDILAVTKIDGSDPNATSEDQFNTSVVWSKDAAAHFRELPGWSEHLALLHPGQYGYQENRDGNPFWGIVVLFNQAPTDPNKVDGQFHIDFRSAFGHYEPENGDIGNKDNYQRYKIWYGPIGAFEP
jgi:predicted HicB family RNase H-like nuclease